MQQLAIRKGGAENASTGKRKYRKGKYETAHFARMENASTENASTMQTFSQKKSLVFHKIAERRIPELIPVLGSQPAGDMSHKPGGRLPGTMSVNSLPKTVTRQRRACDF